MAQTMGFFYNYGTIAFTLYLDKIIVKLFPHACCYFSATQNVIKYAHIEIM